MVAAAGDHVGYGHPSQWILLSSTSLQHLHAGENDFVRRPRRLRKFVFGSYVAVEIALWWAARRGVFLSDHQHRFLDVQPGICQDTRRLDPEFDFRHAQLPAHMDLLSQYAA